MRAQLAAQAEQVGQALNALRTALVAANYPFMAGLCRAAEEAVLVIFTSLSDATITEDTL